MALADDFSQISNQTRDAILINFYLNESFPLNDEFETDIITNVVNVFQNETPCRQSYEAQLIFLLHSSKKLLAFSTS